MGSARCSAEGISIGRRLRDQFHPNIAATGAIFDDEWLTPFFAKPLGYGASNCVNRTAGLKRYDDANCLRGRPGRAALSNREATAADQQQSGEQERWLAHAGERDS
jgi:hypothetical protein